MFPNVNGFQWNFGHILFLTIFFTVLLTVLTTATIAAIRGLLHLRHRRVDAIRWKQEFHDLSERDRACRHEIGGEVENRTCPNAFDCRGCTEHGQYGQAKPSQDSDVFGLAYAANRLYHRGHTWVEPQADGTVLIGLDEIGRRLVGEPDRVELPSPGTQLQASGSGWRMTKNGFEVRILAPIDGEVLDTGGPDGNFYLRVKPKDSKVGFRHLLRGSEVRSWVQWELERLQVAFAPAGTAVALADGGELMHDLISNAPEAKWDAILGEVFLEP